MLFGASKALTFRILGALFLFLFNLIVARNLGPGPAGVYYLALSIVTIVGSVSVLGIDQILLKNVANFKAQGDIRGVHGFYIKGLRTVLISATTFSLILFALSDIISNKLFDTPELATPLKILSFAIIPFALTIFFSELLRSYKKVWQSVLVVTTLTPIFGIILLVIYKQFENLNPTVVSIAQGIGISLAAFGGYIFWSRSMEKAKNPVSVSSTFLVKAGLPVMLIVLSQLLMGWMDTFMLGIFSDTESVGVYGTALRVSKLLSFMMYAINIIVAPKIANLYKEGKKAELETLVRHSTTTVTLISLPVVVVMILFAPLILGLFGQGFVAGKEALIILTVGQAINAVTGPVGVLLLMSGHEKQLRNLTVGVMIFTVSLYGLLIPAYGIVGAAIATTIGMTAEMIGSVYVAKTRIGILSLPTLKGMRS